MNNEDCDNCAPPIDYVNQAHPSLEFEDDRRSVSSSSSSSSSSDGSSSSSTSSSSSGDNRNGPDSSSSASASASTSSSTIGVGRKKKSPSESPNEQQHGEPESPTPKRGHRGAIPTIQPYVAKMERIELFSTAQCYYLISSDRAATAFRVIKMDRTLIEYPVTNNKKSRENGQGRYTDKATKQGMENTADKNATASSDPMNLLDQGADETRKLRRLTEFCTEDPSIYSRDEIRNMLDMIRDGDQSQSVGSFTDGQQIHSKSSGGLEPIVQAHGIVGFIRFLDCYYLTLITKKSKVGSIGSNVIYTIKDTETFPIKPADGMGSHASVLDEASGTDPQSMLLNMWNRGKRSLNLGLSPRELAELRYQGLYQVVDLTKDFFFSYTYDLTQSLQQNMLTMTSKTFPPPPFKNMYMWNYFQTRELEVRASL